jgi:hypothetical protein
MTQVPPERWKEVSPYLDQALTLPETERADFSFREQNASLADLLQKLLDEHSSLVKEQFLEGGPLDHLAIVSHRLGPYQVGELLGSGAKLQEIEEPVRSR